MIIALKETDEDVVVWTKLNGYYAQSAKAKPGRG
jgi:hypothetical protein